MMVLPILSHRPQGLMPEAGDLHAVSLEVDQRGKLAFPTEGTVDTVVQLSYSLHSGLIATVGDAR